MITRRGTRRPEPGARAPPGLILIMIIIIIIIIMIIIIIIMIIIIIIAIVIVIVIIVIVMVIIILMIIHNNMYIYIYISKGDSTSAPGRRPSTSSAREDAPVEFDSSPTLRTRIATPTPTTEPLYEIC